MDSDTLQRDEPADDVNLAQFVNGLKYQAAQTEFQTVVNAHMDELYQRNVHRQEQFVGRQWVVVDDIMSVKQCSSHAALLQIHQQIVSPHYKRRCERLFAASWQQLSPEQWHVAFLFCTGVREAVVRRIAENTTTKAPSINGKCNLSQHY